VFVATRGVPGNIAPLARLDGMLTVGTALLGAANWPGNRGHVQPSVSEPITMGGYPATRRMSAELREAMQPRLW